MNPNRMAVKLAIRKADLTGHLHGLNNHGRARGAYVHWIANEPQACVSADDEFPAQVEANGPIGKCYANAHSVVASLPDDYVYVEGVVFNGNVIEHAWCQDALGLAVECTEGWDGTGLYIGVPVIPTGTELVLLSAFEDLYESLPEGSDPTPEQLAASIAKVTF